MWDETSWARARSIAGKNVQALMTSKHSSWTSQEAFAVGAPERVRPKYCSRASIEKDVWQFKSKIDKSAKG